MLGLAFCAGCLQLQRVGAVLIVLLKLLIAVASLAVKHRLHGERASVVAVPAQ